MSDPRQEYLAELEKTPFFAGSEVKGSLSSMISYYQSRTPRKRIWFRTTGILVILLSAALPVLAAFGERLVGNTAKDIIVAVVAAIIALLSGLNTFFRWDATWHGYTQSLFELYRIRAEWESSRAAAITNRDLAVGLKSLQEAQARAISEAYTVAQSEMAEYFSRQSFPSGKQS